MTVVRLVLALVLAAACGTAQAAPFVIRTAGSNTATVIDQASVRVEGGFRSAWTYEFFREGGPLSGGRAQILGVLELVNCTDHLSRRLKVVHYLASGVALGRQGPERRFTDSLRGSNTDLMLTAICDGPSDVWARRQAANVFDLYRLAWR